MIVSKTLLHLQAADSAQCSVARVVDATDHC